jgi:hypothetical protein
MQGFRNFSNYYQPPKKVLFLDIDGVLQPPGSQDRFEHMRNKEEMECLFKELEEKYGADYRKFDLADVAATYYDWDLDSVKELKRILDETGAMLVISSNWREGKMGDYFPELLKIHDLRKYLFGYTPSLDYEFVRNFPEYKDFYNTRSAEIVDYLRYHPDIKNWVAVDDMNLTKDFPENAVRTWPKLKKNDADICIEILSTKNS